jgi:hypothetical protein
MKRLASALLLAAALVAVASPARAGQVDKKAPFALDTWVALDSTDGPVTLHRVRLAKEEASFKSRIMRPNNSEYLEDVQIQLEFTNTASHDWKARIEFRWLDADGKVIDGYNSSENLDDGKRHDQQTVTLSTLKYGLEHARTLEIHIAYEPD